ncbi:terminase small subunit [Endozoicomonas sp. G2_1]|uniref:terminase small subunit n=1 Tax=Endozoicomonas sp. G2_1 TaxID=2821091 RepID=UPI001ADC9541|nr:terminase small subunit [Endozoicomonas sp. G2_1]MBO9492085.1 terminase small subunit [Endozoicomonas sp. G2_1]
MTSYAAVVDDKGKLNLDVAQIKERYGIRQDKHVEFALAYVSDPRRNAGRAFAKVRGRAKQTQTDNAQACQLLKPHTPVGKFINDLNTGVANVMMRRNIISTEQVLNELIKVGFCDVGDLYDDNGSLIPVADLPQDVSPAIRKIKEKVLSRKIDDETGQEEVVLSREVELHDKKGALQLIGQHLQMFVQKGEIEVKTSVDDLIRDITERNAQNRNGLLPKNNIRLKDRLPIEGEASE